jgi:hypothetical protein
MDVFALAVLERTLELVIDAMPPEQDPEVAVAVNVIQRSIESSEYQDRAALKRSLLQLSKIAQENRQFLIAARLEAFVRDMNDGGRAHGVA